MFISLNTAQRRCAFPVFVLYNEAIAAGGRGPIPTFTHLSDYCFRFNKTNFELREGI